ncbi:hypothetical protein H0H92_016064 [Tricholoma furcatifolium]|nr:hypothetical protein H0H92_016064 [Tricholoma furcatifolium]
MILHAAALSAANMVPLARKFRSYEVKANQEHNCTIVQAARATTATPQFFKPVAIGKISEKFVGASFGHINPATCVLEEAQLVFGSSYPVACLLSIGAGHSDINEWQAPKSLKEIVNTLQTISANFEGSVEELLKRYKDFPGA